MPEICIKIEVYILVLLFGPFLNASFYSDDTLLYECIAANVSKEVTNQQQDAL